jgi:lysophospholipase L1-like esterase
MPKSRPVLEGDSTNSSRNDRLLPARRCSARLASLAVVGLALLGCVLAYEHYWLARPIGEGPAGPVVPRKPFATAWTARKVLLLGLGDSVTAGFGVPQGYGYFDRLAENPAGEFVEMRGICLKAVLPNLRIRNVAQSGSTSIHHVDLLRHALARQDAQTLGLVVMTSGGNDLIHNYGRTPPREGAMYGATLAQARPWIAAYQDRLRAMLDLLEDRFPGGLHVFLADIYDPTDGQGDASRAGLPPWPEGLQVVAAYNDVIHRVAAERKYVHVVPMHDAFLGHGVHCTQFWQPHYQAADPHYWYAGNLEDPNHRGYDAIRRLMLIEIAKVLADRPG